jgi:hypothetical protein
MWIFQAFGVSKKINLNFLKLKILIIKINNNKNNKSEARHKKYIYLIGQRA